MIMNYDTRSVDHVPLITVSHSLCDLSILKDQSETVSDTTENRFISFIFNYSEKLLLILNITFQQNNTQ